MTYFIDIFSVDTFEHFAATDKTRAGFHPKRRAWVSKIKPGDKILCYLKGLSCWIGMLEVTGPMHEAEAGTEIIGEYTIEFPVKNMTWLKRGTLLPIKRDTVWQALSFTQNVTPGTGGWNAVLRSSGVRLHDADGQAVEALLYAQQQAQIPDEIADEAWEKCRTLKMTGAQGKQIAVQIPEAEPEFPNLSTSLKADKPTSPISSTPLAITPSSHTRVQAMLADIGIAMGFQVWVPKADKEAVLAEMTNKELLATLPNTQFSEPAAFKTVEQIDVLWLQKKNIARAFEVEHTTAVYSGILRMADLLALQPNFHTTLHIVAPEERRKKVFQELMRPAFSIFSQGPLSELCSYLTYESVQELFQNPMLEYLKQDVLEKYAESAEDAE